MAMTRKKRRMIMVAVGAVLLAAATGLVMNAMRDSIVFFFGPAELAAKHIGSDRRLRVGGLVATGSLRRGKGETISFEITDTKASLPVTYTGVLPDLFREGQGVIAEGHLRKGVFVADEILAKHDEKYMPREVADELKKSGEWRPEN